MTASAYIEETTGSQRLAADPKLSAFVSANAGAGKTRVLTNRVARLLLEGVDPSTILCITFTKAAAAEMADRLFALLGAWALAGDGHLQKALAELDGDSRIRSAEDLARARVLFARALETPGGLKIQTIHSFCESVLKRFPLEAGVAPGFTVIEELEAGVLKRAAIDNVATRAEGEIGAAFAHLLSKTNGDSLRSLLEGTIGKRRKFARAEAVGWGALGDEVADALGVADGADYSIEGIVDLIAAFDLSRLKKLMLAGSLTTKTASAKIDAFFEASNAREKFDAINQVFLTTSLEPRKDVISPKIAKEEPAFAAEISSLQGDIVSVLDRRRAAEALQDTRAFFIIIQQCFADFDAAKSARAALDFDDLIAKARALFKSDGGVGWVLYKLDKGLEHILLDEAQDTGPDAWDVIEAPLDEFFSGAGGHENIRTFFAVGDQKQSIYSFQGADAALFKEKEADLGKKIGATQKYENVPLKASFRTTAPVLRFVDALFSRDEVVENVSDLTPLQHYCTREGDAGLVELWPLVPKPEKLTPNPWDAPLDAPPAGSPPRILANEIADTISSWLNSNEILPSKGRPIAPGDIMILVQNRGPLFSEMIRALGANSVPVAGADKIKLMEDQGVLDLVSYARAVLYEGDDLSLAETLKSPFFNLDEDSLYDLAANRGDKRLWSALGARRAERPEWAQALVEISAARIVAMNEGAAAFATHILETGAPSGWRRLAGRLGAPCREPIEEFLRQAHDFELQHPRSLRLFLDDFVRSGAEISREASEAGPTVRVMTAHKAKGLEANIVFLIDAHRPARIKTADGVFLIEGPDGDDIPVLALGEAKKNSTLTKASDRAKRLAHDEYRRLLYVAATRARDRLYVCGFEQGNSKAQGGKPPADKTWHALAADAFDALGDAVADAGERFGATAHRLASVQAGPVGTDGSQAADAKPMLPDPCLFKAATHEVRPRRLSPSRLIADNEAEPAFSPARGQTPFIRGRILHRMLELLPEIAPANRGAAADKLLAHHAGAFSAEERAAMRAEVYRVLDDDRFKEVFSPGSVAEAAIGGRPQGAGPGLKLSGQIDRLLVLEDRILAVDYKTNRPPPTQVDDVPPAYLAQMSAYRGLLREIFPGRKAETALLWTYEARLMALPDEALDRAFAQIMTLA